MSTDRCILCLFLLTLLVSFEAPLLAESLTLPKESIGASLSTEEDVPLNGVQYNSKLSSKHPEPESISNSSSPSSSRGSFPGTSFHPDLHSYATLTGPGNGNDRPSDAFPPTGSNGKPLLSRCYGKFGCFSITEPFASLYRPINLFPFSPEILNVLFLLKTRKNTDHFEKLRAWDENSFTSSHFDPSHRLKVIIHGYLEHGYQPWIKSMITELLTKDNLNVISVDWMVGAVPPYTQATANTRIVGSVIADFLRSLQQIYGRFPASDIHLIGHSLGAHIAGYVGERVADIGRITGLDPAEPYFQYTDPRVRLDPSDANFVDVVHTDGSSIVTGGFGMMQGCGHADFYPNGGARQPGCDDGVIESIGKERNVLSGIRRFIGCSHIRAYQFFTESINSDCTFTGFPCASYELFTDGTCTLDRDTCHQTKNFNGSCVRMGFGAEDSWRQINGKALSSTPSRERGHVQSLKYFLQTNAEMPFCRFHYQVIVTSEKSTEQGLEKGRFFLRVYGSRGSTQTAEPSKENSQLIPDEGLEFLMSATDLGPLLRVEFEWKTVSTLLSTFRWSRLFDSPKLYINRVQVINLERGSSASFCGDGFPVKPSRVKMFFPGDHCT